MLPLKWFILKNGAVALECTCIIACVIFVSWLYFGLKARPEIQIINGIEWTWKYHMSAYYKKWKEKYVWEVRKIDSCFYLYSSIWSPMIVFFRVSAVFISVSSFMKFLILNKLNNWV